MKISEALLFIVREAGGEIDFCQWQRWEADLITKGYLKNEYREVQGGFTCMVQLTEKGQQLLQQKGL